MNLDEIKNDLSGAWTGENILRLSWMTPPEYVSKSELTAESAVGGKFLTVKYTWEYENTRHEGLLLLGFDAEKEIVNAAWVDSWHSSVKPLILSGNIGERVIDLRGTYAVPNHPDWGWRIALNNSAEDNLQIRMYNVSPEGAEDLAVSADYQRLS